MMLVPNQANRRICRSSADAGGPSKVRIGRAGMPLEMVLGGTDLGTVEPAPLRGVDPVRTPAVPLVLFDRTAPVSMMMGAPAKPLAHGVGSPSGTLACERSRWLWS